MIHQLTIPDALIEWGKQPEVAVHFPRPWAHQVEEILSDKQPLKTKVTDRLLARLEALCHEAIRQDQGHLLLGFDLFTAEWLGLVFLWGDGDKTVSVGRGKDWSYQEVRALIECPTGSEALGFCAEAKSLVSDVFPRARIGAIIDAQEAEPDVCASCGEADSLVMLTLDSGSRYCFRCWSILTNDEPPVERKKGRRR